MLVRRALFRLRNYSCIFSLETDLDHASLAEARPRAQEAVN